MAEENQDAVPTLELSQTTTEPEFTSYFNELRESLTEVREVNGRIHRVVKCHARIEDRTNRLVFCPIRYKEMDLNVIVHAVDLYIVGLKGEGQTCYVLCTDPTFREKEDIRECLVEHHHLDIVCIPIDHSYSELEKQAGVKRWQISLGKPSLIKAVEFLSTENMLQDLATTALHILCLTQIISESLRIKVLAKFVQNNFEFGKIPHILLLILEHGWANASKRLLREDTHTSNLDVYYSDNMDDPLTVEELDSLYDVLKWYGYKDLNKNVKREDSEFVMTRLFLHACLGKLIKSVRVNFGTGLESGYKVNAVKHTFEDEHVVLQYNPNKIGEQLSNKVSIVEFIVNNLAVGQVHVDVNALTDGFEKATMKPVQIISSKTFVSFEKPKGVALPGTFSNTLRCENDDSVDKEYSLENLEVVATNYISKSGVGDEFDDAWKKYQNDEIVRQYILGRRESLSAAVDEVTKFFDMYPCESFDSEDKAERRKLKNKRRKAPLKIKETDTKHSIALSGKYMGTLEMLLKIDFELDEKTKAVKIDLKVRSDGIYGCRFIHETVAKWLGS